MPELPEVETVKCALAPHLDNRLIEAITVRNPHLRRPVCPEALDKHVTGRRIISVRRRGKFLVLETSNRNALILHLGMTGLLRIENGTFTPRKHDHVIWRLANGEALVLNDARRFGLVLVQPLETAGADPPMLAEMGPEPLSDLFTASYAWRQSRCRTQPVKNTLMDQGFVAGIGNIYANEALWRARISPRRQARNLGREAWSRLAAAIKDVLTDAIAAGGTTIRDYRTVDGSEGRFTACLDVYDRAGCACRRCDGQQLIRRTVMAGRATYYCGGCQR